MGARVDLSLVVPFDGTSPLDLWLRYLSAQEVDWGTIEIIIATTEPDAASGLASPFFADLPLTIVPVELGALGHSAARLRNGGADRAQADRIAFVDSDCILRSDALRRHAASLGIACGWVRELPADRQASTMRDAPLAFDDLWTAAVEDYRVSHRKLGHEAEALWSDCYSSNMSLPLAQFKEVGGFDETGYRCHDMDLGYRLSRAGAKFRFRHDLRSIHLEHRRTLAYRIEQQAGWSLMATKFPELQPIAQHNGVEGRRRVEQRLIAARERFLALTRDLPGQLCGTVFVTHPGTCAELVAERLGAAAASRIDRSTGSELVVRLDRDCWDFSVLVPRVQAVPNWSVIIPAFQHAETLRRAIESVLRQTTQSFEIIVVDDASTDDTHVVAASHAADGRVRYVRHPINKGQSQALNTGLQLAQGALLLQLDADDWLDRGCLDQMEKHFDDPAVVAAFGRPWLWHKQRKSLARTEDVTHSEGHFSNPDVQAPRAYRCSTIRGIGGWPTDDAYEGRYYEDRRMLARMHEQGDVRFEQRALYHVSVRPQSLGRSHPLTTAAAKLVILSHEAALREKQLRYRFSRGLLQSWFDDLPPVSGRWSVIIPHRNQVPYLRLALWSWAQSDLPADGEIIVVDDGSTDPLPSDLREIDQRIRFLNLGSAGGVAAARNKGVAAAAGDWLIFCDADHLAAPSLCRAHAAVLVEQPRALSCGNVFGRRTVTRIERELPPLRKDEIVRAVARREELRQVAAALLNDEEKELITPQPDLWQAAQRFAYDEQWLRGWARAVLTYGDALTGMPSRWLRVATGNLALARAVFDDVEGFDEAMPSREDWEFGIRAQDASCPVIPNLSAHALHQVHPIDQRRLAHDQRGSDLLERKHRNTVALLRHTPADLRPPGAASLLGAAMPSRELQSRDGPPLLALTFDDGPHATGTPLVLDQLAIHATPATFFLLGSRIADERPLCARLRDSGHELAAHGWTHAHPSQLSTREAAGQVSWSFKAVADVAGRAPRFFRPPYGLLTPAMLEACVEHDLTPAGWHVSPQDWAGTSLPDMMRILVREGLRSKILVCHDGTGDPLTLCRLLDWALSASAGRLQPVNLSTFAEHAEIPALEDYQPASLDDWRGCSIEDLLAIGAV